MFEKVQKGHIVTRMLAGMVPMKLNVVNVTDDIIDCGWTFDRKTGDEVDDVLGWGPPPKMTGSFLIKAEDKDGNIICEGNQTTRSES